MKQRALRERKTPAQLARRARRIEKRRTAPAPTYGLLTVERHAYEDVFRGVYLHVFLDDVDVTNDCASADDRQGWALMYQRDREGRKRADRDGPIMTLATGAVRIEKGARIT